MSKFFMTWPWVRVSNPRAPRKMGTLKLRFFWWRVYVFTSSLVSQIINFNNFPFTDIDPVTRQYSQPSILKRIQKAKRARYVIMETIAHILFIFTLLSLCYTYQDDSIFNTYNCYSRCMFKSFKRSVSICYVYQMNRVEL